MFAFRLMEEARRAAELAGRPLPPLESPVKALLGEDEKDAEPKDAPAVQPEPIKPPVGRPSNRVRS